jgi:hypothetical protein
MIDGVVATTGAAAATAAVTGRHYQTWFVRNYEVVGGCVEVVASVGSDSLAGEMQVLEA